MRPILEELKEYPIFSINELSRIVKKPDAYLRLVIHRLKKKELIFKIEKNKYTLINDPLVWASRIAWPSYISGWQALRFYNLTEQLPKNFEVITLKKRKSKKIIFKGTAIEFVKTKKSCFFGYQKIRYCDFEIFMAEPEKAIIDSALFRKISFSELKSMIESHVKEIDKKRLCSYLIKIGNKTLIKKFGYLLAELGYNFYAQFKKYINQAYIPLENNLPAKGEKNKQWRIINNL